MNLPRPGERYERTTEDRRNRALELADAQNLKRGQDVELRDERLILRSPDGTRFSVTAGDDGSLRTTEISTSDTRILALAGYVDIDFPIIVRTTGVGRPVLTTLTGNIEAPLWAVNDNLQIEGQEIIHGYKEASAIQWHIHMLTNGVDVTDRYVAWGVEWAWALPNGQLTSAITTTSGDLVIPANTPDRTHLIRQIALVEMPTMTIATHIWARLTRIASVGTAPTEDIFASMLQLHIDCDTYGSGEIVSK